MPMQFQAYNPWEAANSGLQFGSNLISLPGKLKEQQLANALSEYKRQQEAARAPNYGKLAEAELAEALARPKEIEARTGLLGKQAQEISQAMQYNPQKWQAESQLKQAQIKEQNSLANLHDYQAEKEKWILSQYNQSLQGDPNAMQNVENLSSSPATKTSADNMVGNYGIQMPTPTKQDIVNKQAFGFDTYSDKVSAAIKARQEQEKAYKEKIMKTNQSVQNANAFSNELSSYNYWMDKGIATGPYGSFLPKVGTASQTVNNLINQMSMGAIEQTRDAMGSARFAVADLNVALGMKPQINWSKGTRQFYTEFNDAKDKRLKEMSQFYNVAGKMKIPVEYADALWTSYQNSYPISNREGNKIIKRNGDEWQQFLTPDALNEITTTGEYKPIKQEHITEENIKDTIKQTGLPRKEVFKLLKSKGFDLSSIKE